MTFLTCDWCGYIYPQLKKAECPYCGARKNDQMKLRDAESKREDQKQHRRRA